MNIIHNPFEPSKLKLIWQQVDGKDRTRYFVGELVRAGSSIALYYNINNPDFARAKAAGFIGHPAFKIDRVVHHTNVLEIFERRIPPRSRGDFRLFLERNRLPTYNLSAFALLGYSGAKLPSDGFSLEIDFSIESPPLSFLTEIAGFRYYEGMQLPVESFLNHSVILRHEPSNPHDTNAVQVKLGDRTLGYLNRTLAPTALNWLNSRHVRANIERFEGALVRPQVYLFVSVL